MSESKLATQPFAYVLIVEPDDAVRDSILRTVEALNCAVDVARDEDEAVMKASQHRPQLIIVKQHEPLAVDLIQPPSTSIASRICCRARLSRAVSLVTHTDAAITFNETAKLSSMKILSHLKNIYLVVSSGTSHCRSAFVDYEFIMVKPEFKTQLWRKEWYSYCAHDIALKFLSDHLPFWLGRTQIPPSGNIGPFEPWVRSHIIYLN
jgi:CheY-like chemotaxis protein